MLSLPAHANRRENRVPRLSSHQSFLTRYNHPSARASRNSTMLSPILPSQNSECHHPWCVPVLGTVVGPPSGAAVRLFQPPRPVTVGNLPPLGPIATPSLRDPAPSWPVGMGLLADEVLVSPAISEPDTTAGPTVDGIASHLPAVAAHAHSTPRARQRRLARYGRPQSRCRRAVAGSECHAGRPRAGRWLCRGHNCGQRVLDCP